jgi:hypothetical protein
MATLPGKNAHLKHSKRHQPRWNGDQLRAQLSLYDRRPFLDLLAEWLECSPDPEDIKQFASKYPDRYAGAIRQLAQIGGFTEKREVSVDVHVNIRTLSDSQLEDRLKQLTGELGLAQIIDETAVAVEESSETE